MEKSQANTTTDHRIIKRWTEERNGKPAIVEGTGNTDGPDGLLRIKFSDKDDKLEPISWDDFFEIFEDNDLEFLFQEETAAGEKSRFFKFIEKGNNK